MRLVALLLAAALATSCAQSDPPADPIVIGTETPSPDPDVLPVGKADLKLEARTYYSPDGFVPPLAIAVPSGWTSVHRGDDAFDLSRPDPSKDAPLVVVAILTPTEDTAAEALATVREGLDGTVTNASGTVAGLPAHGFDVAGGSGQLVASPSGTLSLDLGPGTRARVLVADIDEVPLMTVVLVPEKARWTELLPLADRLLTGVTPS